MKIFICTDAEGISCLDKKELITENTVEMRTRLMADVNAAIRGAFDGGADAVEVVDGHGGGNNFLPGELDLRAVQLPGSALTKLDADAVFMVGTHAMSGTPNAFYDHTQSSETWHDYYLNGRRGGEMLQMAAWAGAYGVPLVMVSGDHAACAEAREFFGNIRTACVKYGIDHCNAECLPAEEAERLIYQAARDAIALIPKIRPCRINLPAEIVVEFNRTDHCSAVLAANPGLEQLDGRTLRRVSRTVTAYTDVLL
ncbi:MAG: M55 family metallopeptidase [Oscillospiraceae bacterium]|nr:M55 family metallopeptidase [Oscillospiraceae bacterium]